MAGTDSRFDVSIEEEITKTLSAEIAAEIDFEVLADILCWSGWTRVKRSPYVTEKEAYDIKQWIKHHCKGQVKSHGSTWVFENKKDASHFILRWVP